MWGFLLEFLYGSPCIRQWYWTSLLGLEIPAQASRRQSALIRGDGNLQSPQGRLRPEDYRLPSRGAKAIVSCTSKKKGRAQSEAICSQWEEQRTKRQSDGRPLRICSMESYQITNALNLSESTYDGNLKMVSD